MDATSGAQGAEQDAEGVGPGPLLGVWPGARALAPGSARASEEMSEEPADPPRRPWGSDNPVGE